MVTDTPIHRKGWRKFPQNVTDYYLSVLALGDFISLFLTNYYPWSTHYFSWRSPYYTKKPLNVNINILQLINK